MTAGVRSLFGILIAVVLVALGIYGLQNQEHIAVYFLFFTFHGTQAWIPAGVFALLIFALCLLYGLFSGTVWLFRRRRLVRATSEHQSRAESLSRDLEEARAEVGRLRESTTRREEERPVAAARGAGRSEAAPRIQEPPTEPPARAEEPPAEPPARAEQPPAEPPARADEPPAEPPARAEEPPAEPPARAEQPPAEPPARTDEPPAEPPARAGEPPAEPPASSPEASSEHPPQPHD